MTSDVETNIVAVERIKEYAEIEQVLIDYGPNYCLEFETKVSFKKQELHMVVMKQIFVINRASK
jgi:hypothetical protein